MKLIYLIPIAVILLFLLGHFLIKTTRWIIKVILILAIVVVLYLIFFV